MAGGEPRLCHLPRIPDYKLGLNEKGARMSQAGVISQDGEGSTRSSMVASLWVE